MIKKISIIGSGNVATQLSLAFANANIRVKQIISRNKNSGQLLAKKLNTQFIYNIKNISSTDLLIICVNDDNIDSLVKSLPNIPMVHTSGSTDINIFKKKDHFGVLYPIQSLNKDVVADFKKIPICVEANNQDFESKIIDLSSKISKKVFLLNSKERKNIHLSAVIASNFSNFCYLIAKKNLEYHNLDFSLLKPLILKTAQKIITKDPRLTQTGPAKRGDLKIIKEHLTILKDENYKKIYKLLSRNILKEYEK